MTELWEQRPRNHRLSLSQVREALPPNMILTHNYAAGELRITFSIPYLIASFGYGYGAAVRRAAQLAYYTTSRTDAILTACQMSLELRDELDAKLTPTPTPPE